MKKLACQKMARPIYMMVRQERFHQPATVGVTYFLKLGHMVDDKMHALRRSLLTDYLAVRR